MNAQEQQLIDGLVDRVVSTPVVDKDDEADRYLHEKLAKTPDALYALAQTVLVQQFGLTNAQQQLQDAQGQIDDLQEQLAQAQAQLQQPKKSGSFLGHLLGTDQQQQAPPPPYQGQGSVPYQPVNTGYPPPPPYAQPYGQQPPMYGQPMGYGQPSGGGGFLQGALQTAAGVAAGEMAFRGMEDLFSGFGGGQHERFGGQPTEVINNNYYDEPRDGERSEHREASSDDSGFYDPSHDASREDDSSLQNDFADDNNYSDDNGSDDDGGSFDDGGSDDGN